MSMGGQKHTTHFKQQECFWVYILDVYGKVRHTGTPARHHIRTQLTYHHVSLILDIGDETSELFE
jgi:hypothetical protein